MGPLKSIFSSCFEILGQHAELTNQVSMLDNQVPNYYEEKIKHVNW